LSPPLACRFGLLTAVFLSVSLEVATLAPAPPARAAALEEKGPSFEITYTPEFRPGPISARVYVMLGQGQAATGRAEPRFGPNWFRPQPFFAVDAQGWKPGEPLRVGPDAAGFPGPLATLEPGEYNAQAVVRLNPDTHKLGDGEGNAFGPVVRVTIDPKNDDAGPFQLTVNAIVPPRKFPETDRIKLVEIDSPLLSAFHHRPIKHRAAVFLPPPEGDRSEKRGTLYIIPGFGGDHYSAMQMLTNRRFDFGKDLIRVVLDPDCGTGHHVFADSATNGPRGKALVDELIPHIEKTFPAIAEPRDRLLNGHSSGGWSSLWLQVTYPDTFGGVWSTSPDPVDFRDFQRINIYANGENAFHDEEGKRRALARMGKRAILFYDSFSKMEDVIGDGGQLHSFEAVFSPRGPDGRPRPLWDRATGAIDAEVAKAWEAYDIRLAIERSWPTLAPRLAGKIHIVIGDLDTFYLEGAVRLLKESLHKLGSDAVVEIVPDRDHGTIMDAALADRFDREINATLEPVKKRPCSP
jgi:pimeloyl-ACP methyl ester carboxylesterase